MQIRKVKEGYELNNGSEIVILKDDVKLKHIMESFDVYIKIAKMVGEKPKTFIDSLSAEDKQGLIEWIREVI